MALLWIIGCCGIIADAGLDNGHSLSLSLSLSLSVCLCVAPPLALPPLHERGRGEGRGGKGGERLMAYKDGQSGGDGDS